VNPEFLNTKIFFGGFPFIRHKFCGAKLGRTNEESPHVGLSPTTNSRERQLLKKPRQTAGLIFNFIYSEAL
jgi:hypothetical protein